MAKTKRSREEVETYDSDGGFVSNDDGNAPKSKKSKKAGAVKGGEDQFWALSSGRTPRRVNLSEFKGSKLVNIREYYEKDDEYHPGKKGISLTIDQYKALLQAIPEINASLKRGGTDVGESAALEDEEDDDEDEPKPKRKAKAKTERSNIEETSDEEEE